MTDTSKSTPDKLLNWQEMPK